MKRLSVVIVTYNSEADIYDCLASVFEHNDLPPATLEVIVVDNCSRDTGTMFARLRSLYGEKITLLRNDHNGGYGQGNNVGICHATAPVVLIMNPDVRLVQPVFRCAVEAFEQDAKLGLYGIKQMLTPTEPSSNSFACTSRVNGYLFVLLTGLCNRLNFYISSCMYIQGSCFFINKAIFEQVGLFDETVFMYGEEEDIHYRLHRKFRCHITFNPRLHYLHLTRERKPDIEYEKRLVQVAVVGNEKRGIDRRTTLRNRLRSVRMLILRQRIMRLFGRCNDELREMLLTLQRYLQNELK